MPVMRDILDNVKSAVLDRVHQFSEMYSNPPDGELLFDDDVEQNKKLAGTLLTLKEESDGSFAAVVFKTPARRRASGNTLGIRTLGASSHVKYIDKEWARLNVDGTVLGFFGRARAAGSPAINGVLFERDDVNYTPVIPSSDDTSTDTVPAIREVSEGGDAISDVPVNEILSVIPSNLYLDPFGPAPVEGASITALFDRSIDIVIDTSPTEKMSAPATHRALSVLYQLGCHDPLELGETAAFFAGLTGDQDITEALGGSMAVTGQASIIDLFEPIVALPHSDLASVTESALRKFNDLDVSTSQLEAPLQGGSCMREALLSFNTIPSPNDGAAAAAAASAAADAAIRREQERSAAANAEVDRLRAEMALLRSLHDDNLNNQANQIPVIGGGAVNTINQTGLRDIWAFLPSRSPEYMRGEWVAALGGFPVRSMLAQLNGGRAMYETAYPDNSVVAGDDMAADIAALFNAISTSGAVSLPAFIGRPSTAEEGSTRLAALRAAFQRIPSAQNGPSATSLHNFSAKAEVATEKDKFRHRAFDPAIVSELMAPQVLAREASLQGQGHGHGPEEYRRLVNDYPADAVHVYMHSSGKALTPASNLGVPLSFPSLRLELVSVPRSAIAAEVTPSREEPDVRLRIDRAAAGFMASDIDYVEVVALAGGKRPTLHYSTTIGGAGLGRWGTTVGPNALSDIERVAPLVESLIYFALVRVGDADGADPVTQKFGFTDLVRDACGALNAARALDVALFFCRRLNASETLRRTVPGAAKVHLITLIVLTRKEVLAPLVEAQRTDELVAERMGMSGAARLLGPSANASTSSPSSNAGNKRNAKRKNTSPFNSPPSSGSQNTSTPSAPNRQSNTAFSVTAGTRATATANAINAAGPTANSPANRNAGSANPSGGNAPPPPSSGSSQAKVGGPRGMNTITAKLLSLHYANVPPAQQPCPWLNLFGSCRRAPPGGDCLRCPNGLVVSSDKIDEIRAMCDDSLASRIVG